MSETDRVVFTNARFGELSVDRSSVVTFPQGLPGFETLRTFGLLEREEESPFIRLLSTENPRVGFVLIDPFIVWPDYDPDLGEEELSGLELAGVEQLTVYCIVTLSPVPDQVTANLKGPICVNLQNRRAKQMILVDDRYTTKHSIIGARQQA